MEEDVQAVLDWAVEIAESAPEAYRQAAFTELLSYGLVSLQKDKGSFEQSVVSDEAVSSMHSSADQDVRFDNLPETYLIAKQGTREQQTVWSVIELCRSGKEATVDSVANNIKTKLGISPEKKSNTSTTLRNLTPRYLSRNKRETGKGYAYKPASDAIKIFDEFRSKKEK